MAKPSIAISILLGFYVLEYLKYTQLLVARRFIKAQGELKLLQIRGTWAGNSCCRAF